jgi:hypothetical protein
MLSLFGTAARRIDEEERRRSIEVIFIRQFRRHKQAHRNSPAWVFQDSANMSIFVDVFRHVLHTNWILDFREREEHTPRSIASLNFGEESRAHNMCSWFLIVFRINQKCEELNWRSQLNLRPEFIHPRNAGQRVQQGHVVAPSQFPTHGGH